MSLDPATVIRRMGVVASQVASQATATATTPLSVMVPGGAAEQDAALADFQHTISQAFAASPTWTGEGAKVIDDHLPQIVSNDVALQLLEMTRSATPWHLSSISDGCDMDFKRP